MFEPQGRLCKFLWPSQKSLTLHFSTKKKCRGIGQNDGKIANGSNIPKSCLQASAVQSRGLLILYGTNDPSRHGAFFFFLDAYIAYRVRTPVEEC